MDEKTRIFYLRDEQKHPVACVASRLEGDVIVWAVSMHNPADPYSRTTARNKAVGRLQAGRKRLNVDTTDNLYTGTLEYEPKTVKRDILQGIAGDPAISERTRRAAKYWLATHPEREEQGT